MDASSSSSQSASIDRLHLHRLPRPTQRAFRRCTGFDFLKKSSWYLAGGTALALQEGHRQSVDLDFFLPEKNFPELKIERLLLETNEWETTYRERGTLYGKLAGAKMSFIAYPFFVPSKERIVCGNIKMLLPYDIAAMKIVAISQRGRKRDFVDLYWYCVHHKKLLNVIRSAVKQFPGQEHNINHIIRSLTYFVDAEGDPMPKLFFKATWNGVKRFFRKEAPQVAREILGLD